MVVVRVEWLAGRTQEQKEELVAGITDILGRVSGAERENVHVVLHDVSPSNWGRAGDLVEPPQRGPQEEPTGGEAVGVEARNDREEAPPARATLPELDGATRIFDLEQPREEGMPLCPAHRPGYAYLLHRHHEDEYKDTKPRTCASGVIICMEHTGTHIDALCHQADDLTLYGGVPVKGAQTGKGFTRLGVEEIPPIIAPGVLLDVPSSKGAEDLEQGYAVTGADLEECCERQNVTVEPGSVALIRTGNARGYWDDPEGYLAGPGMAASASYWLAEKGVVAVGRIT
jgi:4-oxalocrotonate tautomerase family enzyme